MKANQDDRLREIAREHGLSLSVLAEHVQRVQDQGYGTFAPAAHTRLAPKKEPPGHLPAVLEAWEELPGNYSYADTAQAMLRALGGRP